MQAILELARRLGRQIAETEPARKYQQAQKQFHDAPELVKLFEDYQQQAEKVARLEEQNQPVEVEDKHRLRELHSQLLADETFKRVTAAQVDYLDLMRKVHSAMHEPLEAIERGEEASSPASESSGQ
jgi:cell fate (sporulation/competence/biofilm development) regulator YlbF (YheA/YmcA/DUF963 family)